MIKSMVVSGMVGSVEVKPDLKNGGRPVMSISLMGEDGKPFQAKVLTINDTVHGFQRGKEVLLDFQDVEFGMVEFGKWTIRAVSVRPVQAVQAAAPAGKAAANG